MTYRTQVASDIVRDGLGLELVDAHRDILAEVFRCDADHTVVLEIFADSIPDSFLDRLIKDAYHRLDAFEDGTPLPPRDKLSRFYRNAAGQLTFALEVPAERYQKLCERIESSFELRRIGETLGGADVVLQRFTAGEGQIALEWDNWMAFTIVAESLATEDLVRRIARSLIAAK